MSDLQQESSEESNPLLAYGALPAFDAVEAEHVVPAIRTLLGRLSTRLEAFESDLEPTWPGLIEPLERLGDELGFSWGIVGHLMGVRNSDALREAHDTVQSEVVEFGLRLAQSQALYQNLVALREGSSWDTLDPAQHRIIDNLLRDAQHSGVALKGEARERFNEIQQELAQLGTRFNNNVLDATKAFGLVLRDHAEVAGLKESLLQLAAQAARDAGDCEGEGEGEGSAADGPWRITLDFPSFFPFMEHSTRRDLRERLYRAHISRAGDGEWDNQECIAQMLVLRREEAALLGFDSYAELSLDAKMAPDVATVEALLEKLRVASHGAALRELEELAEHARAVGAGEADALCHWDIAHWADRLREHRFDYSEEDLRAYFPLPHVLDGLFALAGRLFGVSIEEASGDTPVWHPDVRFYRVRDSDGSEIASFYLDPYSRPAEKRGGAWMDDCVGRSALLAPAGADVRLPVAYLVCNQTPPVDGGPSLMTFSEVTTLFHEFGHGLQHMLTRVAYGHASGIRNVEWDAVELPSQFMENWCYHRETLRGISRHIETGEPVPDELFEKIAAARTYRAGTQMLRQIYFACTDLALHCGDAATGGESAFDVQQRVAMKTTVLPPLAEDRFLCSFGHIFGGGYAAGYYSYKWAEVLSADAFAAFEEVGLDDADKVAQTGRRFRDTVLALGGSRPPMEVFREFRGREPSPDALLRHSGLLRA